MTIRIIGPNDPALDVLQAAIQQQTDGDAVLEIIPWPDYRERLMATLNAESAPDQVVFVPGHIWLPELAAGRLVASLTELFAEVDDDVKAAYNFDDIIPGVATEGMYADQQYLLPFFSDGHILYYRSDLLKLDDANGVPLVSTKEIAALARSVHNPPEVYGLALKANASEIFTDFLPYLWEAGGAIFDANGQPVLDSAINVAALELYCSLRELCPPGTHTYGNSEITDSLRKGDAALVATWGGQSGPIFTDEGNTWRKVYKAAAFPNPWNATWGVAVPANLDRAEQVVAVEIMLSLFTPAADLALIEAAGSPVRQSSYTADAIHQYHWLAAQKNMLDNAHLLPAKPELGVFLGDLYGAVHQAFIGEASPEAALRGVQAKALEAVKL